MWPGLQFPQNVVAAPLPVACALCLPVAEFWNGLCSCFFVKGVSSLPVTFLLAFHSDGEGRKRTSSTCSNESLNAGGTPVTPRRVSWRQRIFLRVASPVNKSPSAMQQKGLCAVRHEFFFLLSVPVWGTGQDARHVET